MESNVLSIRIGCDDCKDFTTACPHELDSWDTYYGGSTFRERLIHGTLLSALGRSLAVLPSDNATTTQYLDLCLPKGEVKGYHDFKDSDLETFTFDLRSRCHTALTTFQNDHQLCMKWLYCARSKIDDIKPATEYVNGVCLWKTHTNRLRDGRQGHVDIVRRHREALTAHLKEAHRDFIMHMIQDTIPTGARAALMDMDYCLAVNRNYVSSMGKRDRSASPSRYRP